MKENKMVKYHGRLGRFLYDTSEWEIRNKYTSTGYFEYLKYRGSSHDGAQIHIPYGITDISYMFEGKSLKTPPVIPDTVKIMDYTFKDCISLTVGASLPYGLKRCGFLYQGCRSLVAGSHMPDTVESAPYMYDGCLSMMSSGHVSTSLKYASGMYRNCKNMREQPVLPATLVRYDNILAGCTFLERILTNGMY